MDGVEVTVQDRICSTLVELLKEGGDIHRCAAARALGSSGNPRAVEPLVEALLDEDEDVRTDAANALINLADPRSAKQLMENLVGDPNFDVKIAAIKALAKMKHEPVVPLLRKLAANEQDEFDFDEEDFYDTEFDSWMDVQLEAIRALGSFGVEEAVPEILTALNDEMGQDVTETAFVALAKLGAPGAAALNDYLKSDAERIRRRVVTALAESDTEDADVLIGECLIDPSEDVRLLAARHIAGKNPADNRLVCLFWDTSAAVRLEALTLAGVAQSDWVKTLLDDQDAAVQRAALDLSVDNPDLLPAELVSEKVRELLDHQDVQTAKIAASALGAVVGVDAFGELSELVRDTDKPVELRRGALQGLARLGDVSIPVLTDMVGDDERQIRLDAMAMLSKFAKTAESWPNSAAGSLMAALRGELVAPEEEPEAVEENSDEEAEGAEDSVESPVEEDSIDEQAEEEELPEEELPEEEDTGSSSMSTLASILDNSDEAARVEQEADESVVLTDEDMGFLEVSQQRAMRKRKISPDEGIVAAHDVRLFSARLLGTLSHDDISDLLAQTAVSDQKDIRLAALDSLVQHGKANKGLPFEAVQPLLHLINDGDRDIRLLAVRALGFAGGDGAGKILAEKMEDTDSFVQIEAIRGLAYLGEVDERIADLVRNEDSGVRLAASEALAAHGGDMAINGLVEFAFRNEGMYRREAGKLLRAVNGDQASEKLLALLQDEEQKRYWQVAVEALEEINRVFGVDDELAA